MSNVVAMQVFDETLTNMKDLINEREYIQKEVKDLQEQISHAQERITQHQNKIKSLNDRVDEIDTQLVDNARTL